ncbi:hypothetical protein M911_00430 [Ectothiorhodospira haloalkaliphila]|uniref:Diguanylate cyclase n=1 Tax=Ectothiorhodospira haloalkaliphila TaxID=421628 RepID=W8KU37_9GAMM|nr:diguanylate cyclase [Ectothiorhodospira haloalkaliphila]AHK80537.1 hypothetical protein M911_00430 [Ectothiorhodospira haloalkaliphila]
MDPPGKDHDTRQRKSPFGMIHARNRHLPRRLGLRPRLFTAFLLVALVPLGLLFVLQYHHTRSLNLAFTEVSLERVAQVQQRRLNVELGRMLDHMDLVASRTQMRLSLRAYTRTGDDVHRQLLERILQDAIDPITMLDGAWIRDAGGQLVAGVEHHGGLDQTDIQPPLQEGSRGRLEIHWPDGDTPMIWVSGPLELDGENIGSVHLLMRFDDLKAVLEDFPHEGLGGKTLLLVEEHEHDYRPVGATMRTDLFLCEQRREFPLASGSGPVRVCDYLMVVLPLDHVPGEVLVYASLDVLTAALREQTRFMLWTVLFMLLLCVLMALAFTRMISRPVTVLARATRALREHRGNVLVREPFWGEFTELARSFNQSAGIITRRTHDLNRELEARRHAQRQLTELANTDALTGLVNRRRFMEILESRMQDSLELGGRLTLLYLDLDGFKPINDQLGHDAGDIVLQVVAERLRHLVRGKDTAARLGGDEFALLLVDDNGDRHPDPRRLARRAEEQLSLPIEAKGRLVRVGCSVGVAIAAPEDKPQDVLNRADAAMYRIKQARRKGC